MENLVRVLLNVGPSFQWFSVDLDICRVKGLELRKGKTRKRLEDLIVLCLLSCRLG